METIKKIAPDKLLMNQLHSRDWQEFWLRLMGRCYWLLRNRYIVEWSNQERKEFSRKAVGDVINKIFIEKKRKWNVERYPDFEDFIVGVIDSHINNLLNKKNKEILMGDDEFVFHANKDDELNAQEILITKELRNQVFNELEAAGAEDDELLIFECLVDGISKAEDIKKELGLNDNEFHNAWRRLKRKRKLVQDKLATNGN